MPLSSSMNEVDMNDWVAVGSIMSGSSAGAKPVAKSSANVAPVA